MGTIDLDGRFTVAGQPGVAWYVHGYEQIWEPFQAYIRCDDEECACQADEESEHLVDTDEGEWIDCPDRDRVICTMVGDDAKFTFDVSDLTPITDEEYCHECGQVGCTADGWPRD